MNLSLLDPFQCDFPEVIEEFLDHGVASCIAFNRRGTLLAAGCQDGSCMIWDFDTRGIAKHLRSDSPLPPSAPPGPAPPGSHSAPTPASKRDITAVSWSKRGHKLLAASLDKSLCLWDVAGGARDSVVWLDTPAMFVQMHPRSDRTCLASPMQSPPVLVHMDTGQVLVLPVAREEAAAVAVGEDAPPQVEVGQAGAGPSVPRGSKSAADAIMSPFPATFDRSGEFAYVGTPRGDVLVVDLARMQLVSSVQVPGQASVRQLALSRNGQYLLINSNDKALRVYETTSLNRIGNGSNGVDGANGAVTPLPPSSSSALDNGGGSTAVLANGHGEAATTVARPLDGEFAAPLEAANVSNVGARSGDGVGGSDDGAREAPKLHLAITFQEAIERLQWRVGCLNGDAELVAAGNREHKIMIWNRKFGQLWKILEGPKESLTALAWHPTRPIIASVTSVGVVYIWAKDYTENWSAFAPDFKELEENEEYVEKEDEFDVVPEEHKPKPTWADEDEEVDIETVEKVAAFSDSDDDEGLYYLPTVCEPDPQPVVVAEELFRGEADAQEGDVVLEDGGGAELEGEMGALPGVVSGGSPDSSGEEDVMEMDAGTSGGRPKRKRRVTEKAAESMQAKFRTPTKRHGPSPQKKGRASGDLSAEKANGGGGLTSAAAKSGGGGRAGRKLATESMLGQSGRGPLEGCRDGGPERAAGLSDSGLGGGTESGGSGQERVGFERGQGAGPGPGPESVAAMADAEVGVGEEPQGRRKRARGGATEQRGRKRRRAQEAIAIDQDDEEDPDLKEIGGDGAL